MKILVTFMLKFEKIVLARTIVDGIHVGLSLKSHDSYVGFNNLFLIKVILINR